MKVMLILPTFGYDHGYPVFFSNSDFPTGFAYIAAAIKGSGHEVVGVNPNNNVNYATAYDMIRSVITESLQKEKPGLIGLGGLSTDFKFFSDAINIIRENDPSIPIVLGGGIVNSDAEFIFTQLKPDFCIKGEAEDVIVKLIGALESTTPVFSEIENLGYWNENTPIFTKQDFNYIDIDDRLFPDYEPFDLSAMIDDYALAARYAYRYTRSDPRPMTIVSARGCPFKCTFCIHGDASDTRKYRARSIDNIIDEISYLYDMYNFNILIILDELFVAKSGRLAEFSSALINAKLDNGWDFDWIFQTHSNSKIDYETFNLAKKAGCYCFTYGLETGSPTVIESMNKKSKLSSIIKATNLAGEVKLGFYAAFIFGDTVETEETIHETMEFFSNYCRNLHISFAAIQPYPGSELFVRCLNNGTISNKLEYYKNIDKEIFNMTSIRNTVWFPWVYLAIYLSRFSNYAQSTNASSCEIDISGSSKNPIADYYNQSIYNIEAVCPHCSESNNYRELLKTNIEKDSNASGTVNQGYAGQSYEKGSNASKFSSSLKSTIVRTLGLSANKYNVARFIKNGAIYFMLSFWKPIYKDLGPLLGADERSSSFVTGCKSCHKRIIVNVASYNNAGLFNKIRILLKKLLRIFHQYPDAEVIAIREKAKRQIT